jgi:cell division protein FtsB
VLVVLLALGLVIWSFYPVARVQYREERAYAQLNAEYESVQARNARLRKQVARLQTTAGVEDEARAEGLVLPGEHPVIVTDKSQPATQAVTQNQYQVEPEQPVEAPSGPWTPVLDFIFGVQE